MRHNRRCSPVCKYNTNGDLVETYYSVKEASRQTGINESTIRHWAKAETEHDGYIYKRFKQ